LAALEMVPRNGAPGVSGSGLRRATSNGISSIIISFNKFCESRLIWLLLKHRINEVLDGYTIADISDRHSIDAIRDAVQALERPEQWDEEFAEGLAERVGIHGRLTEKPVRLSI
jgi:hypothetical protein